jgi:hypothetical protein
MHPEKGDIIMDRDYGEHILILTEPSYGHDHIWATVLILATGVIKTRTFGIDDETGGLNEWWIKVA